MQIIICFDICLSKIPGLILVGFAIFFHYKNTHILLIHPDNMNDKNLMCISLNKYTLRRLYVSLISNFVLMYVLKAIQKLNCVIFVIVNNLSGKRMYEVLFSFLPLFKLNLLVAVGHSFYI